MNDKFLDTNVLLYAASADPTKSRRAEELIAAGGVISVQVLNEFVNFAQGKLGRSWGETRGYLAAVRHLLRVHPVTIEIHDAALLLAERYNLHIYDAMIVSAALHAGCDTVWSEDMHDGLVVDGRLTVRNPFHSP